MYVQPIRSRHQSHVRNLLVGRTVGESFGPVSRVAYLPGLLRSSGTCRSSSPASAAPFVYWRGDGDAVDEHRGRHRWIAPDGSEVPARLLHEGYFNAAFFPRRCGGCPRAAKVADRLRDAGEDPVC
jgi:hypothetical protein